MGILQNIRNAFVSKEVEGFNAGLNEAGQPLGEKLPVHPEWFFTAKLGQPRNINIQEIRRFAKSPWVQMVLNTIKKEISIIPWDIINKDEDDEEKYDEQTKLLKDFFEKINSDKETILDIANMVLTDIGEIDSGVWVKVYDSSSYEFKEVERLNEFGLPDGTENRMVLKDFGQRTLLELRIADSATFLKQIDIYRRVQAYFQYSFKSPSKIPIRFEPDEVVYFTMNKRPQSIYGFSPVQAIQQVLETLMQSTRYNKDFFSNNAMPDGIISLINANPDSMKKFKEMWMREYKGKPHKIAFQNTDAKFTQFGPNQRDMEWLEGQKWYFHLVFGVFGVSPVEAGFHENVNQGNQAGQERVTVKNAIKPFLTLIENQINRFIIPEILQTDECMVKFKFNPKDHTEEQIQFEQHMKEIDVGAMTVNEYRSLKGLDPVEWGDEPNNATPPQLETDENGEPVDEDTENKPPGANDDKEKQDEKERSKKTYFYKKSFEGFISDSE